MEIKDLFNAITLCNLDDVEEMATNLQDKLEHSDWLYSTDNGDNLLHAICTLREYSISSTAEILVDEHYIDKIIEKMCRIIDLIAKSNKELVNRPNCNGFYPLHYAVYNFGEYTSIIKALIENDACPNVIALDGNTPLHIAARAGHFDSICYFLTETDCRTEILDSNRENAFCILQRKINEERLDLGPLETKWLIKLAEYTYNVSSPIFYFDKTLMTCLVYSIGEPTFWPLLDCFYRTSANTKRAIIEKLLKLRLTNVPIQHLMLTLHDNVDDVIHKIDRFSIYIALHHIFINIKCMFREIVREVRRSSFHLNFSCDSAVLFYVYIQNYGIQHSNLRNFLIELLSSESRSEEKEIWQEMWSVCPRVSDKKLLHCIQRTLISICPYVDVPYDIFIDIPISRSYFVYNFNQTENCLNDIAMISASLSDGKTLGRSVVSLRNLCRSTIRKCLFSKNHTQLSTLDNLYKLYIPKTLQHFLCYL